MRRPFLVFFLFILTVAIVSCTKTQPITNSNTLDSDTFSIIGQWSWVSQSKPLWDSANVTETAQIARTLTFDTSGKFSMTHNDSLPGLNFLQVNLPVLLLPAAETDTATYNVAIGVSGCAFGQQQILTINQTTYGINLSADTLLVSVNPCTSRVTDLYIRN
jgi:hypothetical protein